MEFMVLSFALGMDLFSVAIPLGMNPIGLILIFRAAITFSVFHIVLILTGYYVGHFLGYMVEQVGIEQIQYPILAMENWASILGSLVLTGLGIHMMRENLRKGHSQENKSHPLQGVSLLLLAMSVSLDALAAGFSMGMLDVNLIQLSFILGVVIFFIAIMGLGLGHRLGHYMGKRAEFMGGMVLLFLGLHIFWSIM